VGAVGGALGSLILRLNRRNRRYHGDREENWDVNLVNE
jgi:hypothetical protein